MATRVQRSTSNSAAALSDAQPLEQFERSYPAVPQAVPSARDAAARFASEAGASAEVIQDVQLAISEALTNVVVHAYRDADGPGEFELTLARTGDELWILIADAGCGLRARDDSPGLGLGLALMLQLSAELDIAERSHGGTQVTLRFPLNYDRLRRRRPELRPSPGAADAYPESDRGSCSSATAPASPRFSTTR